MTFYHLTGATMQEMAVVRGRDANAGGVVALPCPWHADPLATCLCDLTYGTFWCVTCDRQGACLVQTRWDSCEEVRT